MLKRYARQDYSLMQKSSVKMSRSESVISFLNDDLEGILTPHEDPLVITTMINEDNVSKIHIDDGSSVNILYHHTFDRMDLNGMHMDPLTSLHFLVLGETR